MNPLPTIHKLFSEANISPVPATHITVQIVSKIKSEIDSTNRCGHWATDEGNRLINAVCEIKPVIWDLIAEKVGYRTAKQSSERRQCKINPNLNP
jgi:hypothetical protein